MISKLDDWIVYIGYLIDGYLLVMDILWYFIYIYVLDNPLAYFHLKYSFDIKHIYG